MKSRTDSWGSRPLLGISRYARRGPGRRDQISHAEIELIQRTVSRTPEVMVKVLTRGANSLKSVRAHLAYLNRRGDLEIETDDGERLAGQGTEESLVEDWDLDVEEHFAREEFALKHRYAMVLHTDEPHPHVHLVVKAVSEQGVRLNIRKETLRRWRSEFAAHLRALGVAANATERAVRGESRPPLRDSIYRSGRRGDSRVLNSRGFNDERDAREGTATTTLNATRESVRRGWRGVEEMLRESG